MSELKVASKATSEQPQRKSSDVVHVKNISGRPINLSKGTIEPDKAGKATVAELICHGKILTEVKG